MNALEIAGLLVLGIGACHAGLINIFDHDRAWKASVNQDGIKRLPNPLVRDRDWEQATTECGIMTLGFGILVLLLVYSLIF